MHVIHIVWGMGIGGTENMLADIMNKQIDVVKISLIIVDDVYCKSIIDRLDKRIKIFYINRKEKSRNLFNVARINWIIFREKPDVVHCHTPSLIKAIFINRFISTTFCVTCHATHILFNNYDKYDRVFSISKAVKNDLEFRYNQSSIIIVNGINFSAIQAKPFIKLDGRFSVVQVGRLEHEKKGQELMLNAIHYLVNDLGINNIEYVVIGDGPSKEHLVNETRKMNITKYCKFLGSIDRKTIYSTLQNYNLLVQPSFYEGFGLTVVEGMASKLPVLVSNIEGPLDIVKNGKYGYVFECGNHLELAESIRKVISDYNDDSFCEWIDDNYEYARATYDVKNTALKYLKEYSANV